MWYSASLLFISEHVGHPQSEPLWEERIVLVQAEGPTAAEQKARQIGKRGEHEYLNKAGCVVRWVFKQVERVHLIDSTKLEDGTELFSRFLRDSEVKSLLVPFRD